MMCCSMLLHSRSLRCEMRQLIEVAECSAQFACVECKLRGYVPEQFNT